MPAPTPPKRLRIGHRFYRVSYVEPEQLIAEDGSACNGLCVFDSAEIRIWKGLQPDVMAEIVLHESLHAMHWEAGLTDESTEEQFTTQDAKNLCRFYQDNPAAMRWMFACLKKPKD